MEVKYLFCAVVIKKNHAKRRFFFILKQLMIVVRLIISLVPCPDKWQAISRLLSVFKQNGC